MFKILCSNQALSVMPNARLLCMYFLFSHMKVLRAHSRWRRVDDEPLLVSFRRCQLSLHFGSSYLSFTVTKLDTAWIMPCVIHISLDAPAKLNYCRKVWVLATRCWRCWVPSRRASEPFAVPRNSTCTRSFLRNFKRRPIHRRSWSGNNGIRKGFGSGPNIGFKWNSPHMCGFHTRCQKP